jgi:imidazolonepropionase-like amidohydrolase
VIQNATVLTGDGRTIAGCDVQFQNGAISAVGEKIEAGLLARRIDAKGKFVAPGLVDVWSTIGISGGGAAGRVTAGAADAFDRYALEELGAAWQQGITTVYVPARTNSGFGGAGAVIHLLADAPASEMVLNGDAFLCATIDGAGTQGALLRVRSVRDLRRALQDAKDYRQAREDYDEELKEYDKKLQERAKKEAGPAKEHPKTQPAPGGRKEGPGEAQEPPKADTQPATQPAKPEEIKKPAEPPKDRAKELLLKLLDGELRLRVEAHRPEDILNLLDVARELNVALILEGAGGAHRVSEQVRAQEVPVVLGDDSNSLLFSPGPARDRTETAAALLQRAGITVYLGTGVGPIGGLYSPTLTLRVAQAIGHGLVTDDPIALITSTAAKFLGVDKKVGRLAPGLSADIVIWSDHPLAPGARAERVFVAGSEVYTAPGGSPAQEEE